MAAKQTQIQIGLTFANGGSLDRRDIALIETLQRCRSIIGASKLMGLSYRKTWLMTDALNRAFESKVVASIPGGTGGGGTEVTAFGERLVALFRAAERRSAQASAAAIDELTSALDYSFELQSLDEPGSSSIA